jgi:hypothetical protein
MNSVSKVVAHRKSKRKTGFPRFQELKLKEKKKISMKSPQGLGSSGLPLEGGGT